MGVINKIFCKELQEENKVLKTKVETLEEKAKSHQTVVDKTNKFYKGILKKHNIEHP